MSPSTPSGVTVAAAITNYGATAVRSVPSRPPSATSPARCPARCPGQRHYSDYQQALTYGTFIRFHLTISGTDVGNPNAVSGTDFSILLEDSTGMG